MSDILMVALFILRGLAWIIASVTVFIWGMQVLATLRDIRDLLQGEDEEPETDVPS